MLTTHYDPDGRLTVFERLKELGLNQHVISIGRLDFNSEGLLIITNNGDIARVMELPEWKILRAYDVRVFGPNFNERRLSRLRSGCKIDGIKYGPYKVEVLSCKQSNTWLHMKLYSGKNNEIRRVMENN